jgi:GABA permease
MASVTAPDTLGLPRLERSLRPRHVAMIAVGGIIGAGLFVGSSATIAAAGPAAVVSYGIAGIIVLLVMRMLSEMAVAVPGLASFPDFPREGLGDWAGFVSGWLYWYFWVVVVAVEAIAGANIVHLWLPNVAPWAIGFALMALLTAVNLLSTRSYGEFEFWFSSLKIAAIIVFLLLAAAFAFGITAPAGPTFANLTAHGGFAPHGWLAALAGVTSTIFSLTGAEIATVAAAESNDPVRTVSRMTGTVAARILIFYVLSILLIVSVVPWTSIVPGLSPFGTALSAMHIPGAAAAMNVVVLIAVLSCLNSGLYVTSRVLFSLAARREAPRGLVTLSSRGVPARAILVASLFSYAALGASAVLPNVFSFLLNASGAVMLIVYLMVALAEVRLRTRLERTDQARLTLRMWFHPWGAIIAIVAMAAVLVAMALTPDLASQFYASLVPLVIVLAAWAVIGRLRGRRG